MLFLALLRKKFCLFSGQWELKKELLCFQAEDIYRYFFNLVVSVYDDLFFVPYSS